MTAKTIALQFLVGLGASFVAIAVAEALRAPREPRLARPVAPGHANV